MLMPALSPTMTVGKIARWAKAEGDAVASGDTLAEVETDKATIDFTFQDDAFLAKILVPAGAEDVAVGTPLALVVENAGDVEEVRRGDFTAALAHARGGGSAAAAATPAAAAAAPSPPAASTPSPSSSSSSSLEVSALPAHAVFPSARLLMAANGVRPTDVTPGSGKGGRITKGDVLVHLGRAPKPAAAAVVVSATAPAAAPAPAPAVATAPQSSGAAPTPFGGDAARGFTDTKPTTIRKVIAARLTESKARVPHQYAVMDCRLDALLKLRVALKDAGINLSVNDMVRRVDVVILHKKNEINGVWGKMR